MLPFWGSDHASALTKIGVRKGQIVTVCMINSPRVYFLIFALNKIGAVANMICGADSPSEILHHICDAKSDTVFILDLFQDKLLEIVDDLPTTRIIVSSLAQEMSFLNRLGARILKNIKSLPLPKDDRFLNWNSFIEAGSGASPTEHDPIAPAVITYTGGTTGGSKGVVLNNTAILSVAQQYIIGEKELYRKSTWMQVMPLFIAYGVTCSMMIPLMVGMTLIIRLPMSDSITVLCKKFKPNHIIYGAPFWEEFADNNVKLDLSYLIAPISGGDTLTEKAERKIDAYLEKCGCHYKIMNGYGMTEVGAAVSVNFRHAFEFGSVGAPFVKNIVSAFDIDTGKELPYGQEGEICIHAPSMMVEYLNNPIETEKIMRKHEDGLLWIHSGDLGFISERGFIHISGRLKRYTMTFFNGVAKKIFSLDIERVIEKHESVERCVVVPIPDEKLNQVPVAFIILKNEISKAEAMHSLKPFAEENLKPLYRPVKYFSIDNMPLTKVGKVDYLKLEKEACSRIEGKGKMDIKSL